MPVSLSRQPSHPQRPMPIGGPKRRPYEPRACPSRRLRWISVLRSRGAGKEADHYTGMVDFDLALGPSVLICAAEGAVLGLILAMQAERAVRLA